MNITNSLFLSLPLAERRSAVEAVIFASSASDELTLQGIRNAVLADVINEHDKAKTDKKIPRIEQEINAKISGQYNVDSAAVSATEPSAEAASAPYATFDTALPLAELAGYIEDINAELRQSGRPYVIVQAGGCYQFATLPQYGELVEAMLAAKTRKRFSAAQLETLAIIAYKQPITKPEVDRIRGVTTSSDMINSLIEKELIAIAGRRDTLGKPLLYATTTQFLRTFGLNDLAELPRLAEIEEIAERQLLADAERPELLLDVTEEKLTEEIMAETTIVETEDSKIDG